jgi:hypothetical protein
MESNEPPEYEAALDRAKAMRDEDFNLRERITQGHRARDARVSAEAQAAEKPLPPKPSYYATQSPAWRRAWDLAAKKG